MAIDPIFIAVEAMPDFKDAGGVPALAAEGRDALAEARGAPRVRYAAVRAAKGHALRAAFDCFADRDLRDGSVRADDFNAFVAREGWWLADYSLFRALHDEHGGEYWRDWDAALGDRQPDALAAARARLGSKIRYYQYLQWIADAQWQQARRDCGPVGVFGDFPFMVNGHSADVWARQREFHLDASVGVPPEPASDRGAGLGAAAVPLGRHGRRRAMPG